MAKLTITCKCGDSFTLATSKNVGAWDDFRAWGASLARWMDGHDEHGGITLDNETVKEAT